MGSRVSGLGSRALGLGSTRVSGLRVMGGLGGFTWGALGLLGFGGLGLGA